MAPCLCNDVIPFQKSEEMAITQCNFPEEHPAARRSLLLEESSRNIQFPLELQYGSKV